MAQVEVVANLPFPLPVNGAPLEIESHGTSWSVKIERVKQGAIDQRLARGGSFDLQRDRAGQVAYSRAVATGTIQGEPDEETVLDQFLGVLNFIIRTVRDVLSEYWIRPLEVTDLRNVRLTIDDEMAEIWSPGRVGGVTLPIVGLTEEADARLKAALEGSLPPVWREMQLDAHDALDLGRYEDTVVLAWSALECACRQALPALAYKSGTSIKDLAGLLKATDRMKKTPPYSLEEVVERVSNGLDVVRVAAELCVPLVYAPDSVAASVQLPYVLRNKIVHQGVRVGKADAEAVLEAIDFVLNQALTLRDIEAPPATASWETHFGEPSKEIAQFASSNHLHIVLAHPRTMFFDMEMIGESLWVRLQEDVSEPVAVALLLAEWEAWKRREYLDRPHLRSSPTDLFLTGLVHFEESHIEMAVCRAEALLALAKRSHVALIEMAEYSLHKIVTDLAALPPIDINDVRCNTVPAHVASYLSVLPPDRRQAIVQPLYQNQKLIGDRAIAWAELVGQIDPEDKHGRCEVYRRIHRDCLLLDTIVVVCPIEKVSYGSGRRPEP